MPISDYLSQEKRSRPPCEGIRNKLKDCLMFSDCYTRVNLQSNSNILELMMMLVLLDNQKTIFNYSKRVK